MSEKITYPLTPAQRMHFYTQMQCSNNPEVLNIATSVLLNGDMDFETLRNSFFMTYDRYEAAHIRFSKDKSGDIFQYISNEPMNEPEFLDFKLWGKTQEDAEAELKRLAAVPFERFDTQMFRVYFLKMPNGYTGVFFVVDHMVCDSSSIIVFLGDVIEIYCNKLYDTPFPKELRSYTQALKKDLKYTGSKAEELDRIFWEETVLKDEPLFTDILGPARLDQTRKETGNPYKRSAKVTSPSVQADICTFSLEEEPSNRLIDYCKQKNVPMVCLLLSGLRTYLSKFNRYAEDISVKTTVSRRGTILERKSGGTRIHFFPFRMQFSNSMKYIDSIRKIQEMQNKIFRHANYDPIKLNVEIAKRFGNQPGESYDSVSLTYQPMSMRESNDMLKDIDYEARWISNGVAAQPYYLTVMHNPETHGLDFFWEYQKGAATPDQLEYIYYYLCKILFEVIEDDERTINEIIETV